MHTSDYRFINMINGHTRITDKKYNTCDLKIYLIYVFSITYYIKNKKIDKYIYNYNHIIIL